MFIAWLPALYAGDRGGNHLTDPTPAHADSIRIDSFIKKQVALIPEKDPMRIQLFREAASQSHQHGYYRQEAYVLMEIGKTYFVNDKYDSAAVVFAEGAELAKQHNLNKAACNFITNIGSCYLLQNKPARALRFYLQAIDYAKDDSSLSANAFINVATIFCDLHQYDKAASYGRMALHSVNNTVAPMLRASAHLAVAKALYEAGRPEEALTEEKAINAILAQQTFPVISSQLFALRGRHALKTGKAKEADILADSAIATIQEDATGYIACVAYNLKAMSRLALQDQQGADLYLKKSLSIAQRIGEWMLLRDTYFNMAKAAERAKRFEEANQYLHLYEELKDKTRGEEVAVLLNTLESEYETEKRSRQINQLKLERSLQQSEIRRKNLINYALIGALILSGGLSILLYRIYRQKQQLQQRMISELEKDRELDITRSILLGQEEERKRLAKDLHDGLGGMLSSVKFAFQKSKATEGSSVNETRYMHASDLLDQSIIELRRIAHNMIPESLAKYGIAAAIRDYCTSINKSGKLKVVFQSMNADEVKPDLTVSNTIFRIVQELLNNVLRHAEAQQAIVQLSRESNMLSITVEDDGRGFDLSAAAREAGMGWCNIRNRVKFLKGQMDIQSSPGNGTYVHVAINLKS
jgi:two-component system NarL family sensor kinase